MVLLRYLYVWRWSSGWAGWSWPARIVAPSVFGVLQAVERRSRAACWRAAVFGEVLQRLHLAGLRDGRR